MWKVDKGGDIKRMNKGAFEEISASYRGMYDIGAKQ